MIDHTVLAVEGGKDVAMATITHLAVGITMAEAVGINPIWAMVKAVAVVYPLNHKARPNQCAIDVEWGTIGLRYERLPNIYVTSIKESLKGKNPETHLVYKDGENNFEHDQDDLMEYETYDCLKESSW